MCVVELSYPCAPTPIGITHSPAGPFAGSEFDGQRMEAGRTHTRWRTGPARRRHLALVFPGRDPVPTLVAPEEVKNSSGTYCQAMSTVVAIASDSGVAIAGDTRRVEDRTVTSGRLGRVYDFGGAGAGVVGEPTGIQAFGRQLESELRTWRLEREYEIEIDALARIVSRLAGETDVEAAVGARDADGTARLGGVSADNRVLEGPVIALGSGTETALGKLETVDPGPGIDDIASTARSVVRTAVESDVASGGTIDVWSLDNDGATTAPDR